MNGYAAARRVRGLGACVLAACSGLLVGCGDQQVVVGQSPPSTNIFVDRISISVVDKIDLLLMIDNSVSMGDKQGLLQDAIPTLVNRLTDPICMDERTREPLTPVVTDSQICPVGSKPEFPNVEDIHIGVVTSSLGGHGGVLCTPQHGADYWNETQNDVGRLIARSQPAEPMATWNDQGFLAWDPKAEKDPPGEADAEALVRGLQNLITGAGEQGCGYEASLEAWYRFLIQPDPPLDVMFNDATGQAEPVGLDTILLAQRAQFLRPDSLVAIIMLSDENDCSIADGGISYLVGDTREGALPRSTTVCDTNPNDPCCLSCIQANWPEGCGDPMADPKCAEAPVYGDIDPGQDRLNLRCFDQKRRFGLDFLNPISRYVDGLQLHELETRDGQAAPNPLFAVSEVYEDLVPRMDSSLIFLAGIIGVPWQDIATDESLADPVKLEYLTPNEITTRPEMIWDMILGHPRGNPEGGPPVPPTDPFMIESIEPRSGNNPRTRESITEPQPGAGGNPINGHEYTILNNGDLQYACVFPLATPRDCLDAEPGVGCDCKVSGELQDRPLCQGTTQVYAKAYPGTRFLQVLKGYGANSIVASICPKNTIPSALAIGTRDPNYGYNPAMTAITNRLKERLRASDCLPRQLAVDETGLPLCRFWEATTPHDPAPCGDSFPGRAPAEPEVVQAIHSRLHQLDWCGTTSNPCDSVCELTPAPEGPERDSCLNDPDEEVSATGWCYIDAMRVDSQGNPDPLGNPELVADCHPTERRRLRFVSPPGSEIPVPWPGATLWVSCQWAAYRTE